MYVNCNELLSVEHIIFCFTTWLALMIKKSDFFSFSYSSIEDCSESRLDLSQLKETSIFKILKIRFEWSVQGKLGHCWIACLRLSFIKIHFWFLCACIPCLALIWSLGFSGHWTSTACLFICSCKLGALNVHAQLIVGIFRSSEIYTNYYVMFIYYKVYKLQL